MMVIYASHVRQKPKVVAVQDVGIVKPHCFQHTIQLVLTAVGLYAISVEPASRIAINKLITNQEINGADSKDYKNNTDKIRLN